MAADQAKNVVWFPRRHPGVPLPMSEADAAETQARLAECGDLLAALKAGRFAEIADVERAVRERFTAMRSHLEAAGVPIGQCRCGVIDLSPPCIECSGGTRAYAAPNDGADEVRTR